MIISCSRRTDIPAFYSEWIMNRLRNGSVCVMNPFNTNQISRIPLSTEIVDCIVFWTKNPKPLLKYLDEIDNLGYKYYFQFTITPYQREIESRLSNKKEIIKTFVKLSQRIGKEKVILRYDPIFLSEKYTVEYHIEAFERLCEQLADYCEKVVISFIDVYRKNKTNMEKAGIQALTKEEMIMVSSLLKEIADRYELGMETCAEGLDLSQFGINHSKCIDGDLIERIIGYDIMYKDKKDNNREHCGCMGSIDIGQYDTCLHECIYCYANVSNEYVKRNHMAHNPKAEILIGEVDETMVKVRKGMKSFRINTDEEQLRLF